jgi:hypothetical protein
MRLRIKIKSRKMKARALFTFFLYVLPNLIIGQTVVVSDVNLKNPEIMILKNSRLSYNQIGGKPYLLDSFVTGKVFMTKKQMVEMKLRYDIYTNEIEIWNNPKIYYLIKSGFDSILMDKIKLIYGDYRLKSKIKSSYFIVVAEGKYCLLMKKNVEFIDQDEVKPYADTRPARFQMRSDIYYLKEGSNPAMQINSKKLFKEAFPELFVKAEPFIKKENINFSKQDDLLRLIQFLNKN